MNKITIKIKSTGQVMELDAGRLDFNPGDWILVETPACKEIAIVAQDGQKSEEESEGQEIPEAEVEIIRKLGEKDLAEYQNLKKIAQEMILECQKKVEYHGLPMEIIDAELSFDEKKLTFYFSAAGRVDFRILVSDLASTFRRLIRLQQVGVRDEAAFCGGHGRCGQELCCRRFKKDDLDSITIDMAQIQGLATMGSNRITGCCGKLMCCLAYENDEYKKTLARLPKIGEKLKTKNGVGEIVGQNLFKGSVTVEFEDKTKLEQQC
ncbi:MAG: regulatory iron-sulfur-containing complex subunit RicT [Candidatus Berkelbacteria bacterium]|nr:regulatory iron-sulfur-containing complex subunit RicT [Candidatus Berkelbacteria bacterium]